MLYLSDDFTVIGEYGVLLRVEPLPSDRFSVEFVTATSVSIVRIFKTHDEAREFIQFVCVRLRQSGNVVLTKE